MDSNHFRPRAAIGGVPIHAMLVPFPIVCFIGALLSDITYSRTAEVQWTNFSQWLLAFGTMIAGIAALFGLIDLLGNRAAARPRIGYWHLLLNVVVFILSLFNNFVHARDGWTSVVPTGLTLSWLTVIVMIASGFLGHRMAYARVDRPEFGEDRP